MLRGMLIGLAIAAPVGPIGALCIGRTLRDGWPAGFASGLGAAVADACYGALAAFGFTAAVGALIGALDGLRLLGGLFLCYLGLRALRSPPVTTVIATPRGGLLRAFGSTFALTIANPLTILSFAAIFAGVGVGVERGGAGWLVAGVFAGSALWWLALSGGVGLLRRRLTAGAIRAINIASGLIIAGFGVAALASLVWRAG
jgi:threonine/homoserine/homoserine lactone efflux protein